MYSLRGSAVIGIFIVWSLVVSISSASAQQAGNAISGTVRDSSGGVLPGVSVQFVSEATSAATDTTTSADGTYASQGLEPGAYRVSISLDGFEPIERRVVVEGGQTVVTDVTLSPARFSQSVVVTARRVEEQAQEVPIPVSVVRGDLVSDAGAFNVNRLKEMIPTVQFYSSNPRNSAINIRGLGAPFGLTNDGLEPGVGLYIDGVFYARPASATLDFLDVDQVEVLRGPQGTLFGKNTTAGAINVTTRKPAFTPATELEVNYGNAQFVQAKASITGPLGGRWAGRVSFSGTQRDGTIYNVKLQQSTNALNNVGLRGQLLYAPSENVAVNLSIDNTRQRANGYTQVPAGVAPTKRPANRQWAAIAADLNYAPPSLNAFDRKTDIDSPLRSNQDLGGASLNVDWKLRSGQITSTTSWRYWDWDPSNDRDFIGLPVTTVSAGTSKQRQWTQEVRYSADLSRKVNFVGGAFLFGQRIQSDPVIKQEQGSAAYRFLLAPSALASTPGLLDGYGFNQYLDYQNLSAALFGQVQWSVNDRLRILPGLRLNYDQKEVDFDQQVYGGLQTTDPALAALKLSVLAPQAYTTDVDDTNLSGQITAAYKVTDTVNTYGTFATGFKSVGLNLNGLPTDALGRPILSTATVKPEDVHNYEFGVKTTPLRNVTANVAVFDTEIKDYQAQVTNGSVGVVRGYLANAEKVRVRGAEVDSNAKVSAHLYIYGALAYTDAKYISFPDAPPAIEDTGGPAFVDISGTVLPGISKVGASIGGEWTNGGSFFSRAGEYFVAIDTSYRSSFSSSATYSQYMVIPAYSLVNARVGFRVADGWTLSVWSRNLFDKNYYELMSVQPGNSGLIEAQPGDPRTAGVTLRISLNSR